jgi:adenylate cyclase
VQGKVAANFVDSGEHSLKNIARPVRVYRVELGGESATQPAAPAPTLQDKPSIAVLPFQNMSGDPEQDYFCNGLVEDIITTLSKLAGLRVIARNSSLVYKGRSADVREAAKQLGVRYVLVLHRALPDLQRMKLCYSAAASSAPRSVFSWCD